jgi:hypothetical protein
MTSARALSNAAKTRTYCATLKLERTRPELAIDELGGQLSDRTARATAGYEQVRTGNGNHNLEREAVLRARDDPDRRPGRGAYFGDGSCRAVRSAGIQDSVCLERNVTTM